MFFLLDRVGILYERVQAFIIPISFFEQRPEDAFVFLYTNSKHMRSLKTPATTESKVNVSFFFFCHDACEL